MPVLLILILASLGIATVFLIGFVWAVRAGQFDDTSTPAMRILGEEGNPPARTPFINTPLQRGGSGKGTPSSASAVSVTAGQSHQTEETAKAVDHSNITSGTPLKRGVNERSATAGIL